MRWQFVGSTQAPKWAVGLDPYGITAYITAVASWCIVPDIRGDEQRACVKYVAHIVTSFGGIESCVRAEEANTSSNVIILPKRLIEFDTFGQAATWCYNHLEWELSRRTEDLNHATVELKSFNYKSNATYQTTEDKT